MWLWFEPKFRKNQTKPDLKTLIIDQKTKADTDVEVEDQAGSGSKEEVEVKNSSGLEEEDEWRGVEYKQEEKEDGNSMD